MRVRCGARTFVVAEKLVAEATLLEIIERDIAAEALPDSWAGWKGEGIISLAVTADGEPLEPRLYNFLPMGEAAEAPFAGYLDAPFFATLDRQRVQPGVALNDFLLETAQALAIEGGDLARSCLPRHEARQAILDFILWSGPRERMLDRVIASGIPLVPTIARRGTDTGWARIDEARTWQGNTFLSPDLLRATRHFRWWMTKSASLA